MPGSKRRSYLCPTGGPEGFMPTAEELAMEGPTIEEWMRTRVARHRIGDAELLPKSRSYGGSGATPEGDLTG